MDSNVVLELIEDPSKQRLTFEEKKAALVMKSIIANPLAFSFIGSCFSSESLSMEDYFTKDESGNMVLVRETVQGVMSQLNKDVIYGLMKSYVEDILPDNECEHILKHYVANCLQHQWWVRFFTERLAELYFYGEDPNSHRFFQADHLKILGEMVEHDSDKLHRDQTVAAYAVRVYNQHWEEGANETHSLQINVIGKKAINDAWANHVKTQPHHPEHWDASYVPKEKDLPDEELPSVNGTKMTTNFIIQMIGDWMAASLLRHKTASGWYEKTVGSRFIFSKDQMTIMESLLSHERSLLEEVVGKNPFATEAFGVDINTTAADIHRIQVVNGKKDGTSIVKINPVTGVTDNDDPPIINVYIDPVSGETRVLDTGEDSFDRNEIDRALGFETAIESVITVDTPMEKRGPISEAVKKKLGKYIYHGTHRDFDIKELGTHVCKNRANLDIKTPVVYMNRLIGIACLHCVPYMVGHSSKKKDYQEHFVALDHLNELDKVIKEVTIIHNDPDLKDVSGEQTGWIFFVDAEQYKDALYYATPDKQNDWNFVSYRHLPIAKKEKISIKWNKKYDETFAKKVKSGYSAIEAVLFPYFDEDFSDVDLSIEALGGTKDIKQRIIDYVCSCLNLMDPTGDNGRRFSDLLSSMNEKQFAQWIEYLKSGETQIDILVPNMKKHLQMENIFAAAHKIKCKIFDRVWIYDMATGREYLSTEEFPILRLTVRRQEQMLDEKLSVPDKAMKIDSTTGQVTGDDRAGGFSMPEIQILFSKGFKSVLKEFVKVRGGDVHAFADFERQLEETGEGSLTQINTNSRARSGAVLSTMLEAIHLDNNI